MNFIAVLLLSLSVTGFVYGETVLQCTLTEPCAHQDHLQFCIPKLTMRSPIQEMDGAQKAELILYTADQSYPLGLGLYKVTPDRFSFSLSYEEEDTMAIFKPHSDGDPQRYFVEFIYQEDFYFTGACSTTQEDFF